MRVHCDITVIGGLASSEELVYSSEREHLVEWHRNNLSRNINKTNELIRNFRKGKLGDHAPVLIGRLEVERAGNFKFLALTFLSDLS